MKRILFLFLVAFAFSPAAEISRSQSSTPTQDTRINLSGIWEDAGERVTITDSDGTVTARYSNQKQCRHEETVTPYTSGFIVSGRGSTLSGTGTICYYGPKKERADPPATPDPSPRGVKQDSQVTLTVSADGNTLEGTQVGYHGPISFTLKRKKCESNEVAPWFDLSSCRDMKKPKLLRETNSDVLSVCGFRVFSWAKNTGELAPFIVSERIRYTASLPEVCCDRLREAARTGKPCDPRPDIDCDGKPNESDVRQGYSVGRGTVRPVNTDMPEINYENFIVPPSTTQDPSIPYRSLGPGNEAECECKWELINAIAKCQLEGLYYEATWICPSTGLTRETGRPSDPRVPCESPRRAQLLPLADDVPWHFLNFLPEPQ